MVGRPNILIMTIGDYYRHKVNRYGWKYMFTLTDSYYPMFLALGYYDRQHNEIVVAKIGKWKKRYIHELGHVFGFKHVMKKGHIMHPWGILRGWDGTEKILGALGNEYEYFYGPL